MKETNLQIFAKLFADEEGINDFIVENFNNQNDTVYELNGIEYTMLTESEVQDQLDEDFEAEVWEFATECERINYRLSQIIERSMSIEYNYKTIKGDYDTLSKYNYETSGDGFYIYTEKF